MNRAKKKKNRKKLFSPYKIIDSENFIKVSQNPNKVARDTQGLPTVPHNDFGELNFKVWPLYIVYQLVIYHHLFTLSARSYTIPRNFYDAFSTPVAINLIRFRDFGERLIGEDARGSSSKGLLVYPPLVLAATVCGYDRTRYVARAVQQLLLASTTRRRDGSRRNKREKA